MNKVILMCLLLCCTKVSNGNSLQGFFTRTDQLLQTYVDNGKIDYKKLRMESATIKQLYKEIGTISLEGKSRKEIKAFYLNAYNIIVIHETLFSKRRRKLFRTCKFFKEIKHTVSGQDITLEKLERKYLLLKFRDPNVYFFLGHSTRGKSEFQEFAVFPQKIDQQLQYIKN